MSNKVSKGFLTKDILDENGEVSESIPFLPRTLATEVIMNDGESVEHKLKKVINTVTFVEYDTYDQYMDDYNNNIIPRGVIGIIKEEQHPVKTE